MNDQQTPISEEEIQAYVDGSLAEHRGEEIDRLLERDEALAAKISDFFSLNSMFHDRYDRVLSEPVPQRLLPPERKRWRDAANWPQFAGMAAALVLGVGIGVAGMTNNKGRDAVGAGRRGGSVQRASHGVREAFARQSALSPRGDRPEVSPPGE